MEEFKFETYKNNAVPLKKEFWDWLMSQAKESGIEVYEQDWMKNQIRSMPILRNNYNAKEQWLNSMAIAAKENDVDIFYCMQTVGAGGYDPVEQVFVECFYILNRHCLK